MSERRFTIVGIGEVLWDMFPEGRQLGGATANFAFHSRRLGDNAYIVSRIGNDDLGGDLINTLRDLDIPAEFIQRDSEQRTGEVDVTVAADGEPSYTIVEPAAWDFIEFSSNLTRLASRCECVCFGSLAQRRETSHETVIDFVLATPTSCLKVFDVNLREHFFSEHILRQSLEIADIVKLNEHELRRLCELLGIGGSGVEQQMIALREDFGNELICVTRGAKGCILRNDRRTVEHAGYETKVIDTVGAGDAFTAALAYHYLRDSSLDRIAEAANRIGSLVASRAGGTPVLANDELGALRRIA